MAEAPANQKWKQLCWRALCVYATLCTVLVTVYVGLLVWYALFEKPAPLARGGEEVLSASYASYMETEYPRRGSQYNCLAEALSEFVNEKTIREADLFRYLGSPDQFYVTNVIVPQGSQSPLTNKMVLFAYLFNRSGPTNKWSVTAVVGDGKVEQVTLRNPKEIERMGFQPFSVYSAPNHQSGADGSQPPDSGANGAPAAAGSRRSP